MQDLANVVVLSMRLRHFMVSHIMDQGFGLFLSISVYLSSLLPEIEAAQRDSTMYTQYFVFHGQSLPSIKKARIVLTCLNDSMSGTDLLDKSS